jgi:hypothetical protein
MGFVLRRTTHGACVRHAIAFTVVAVVAFLTPTAGAGPSAPQLATGASASATPPRDLKYFCKIANQPVRGPGPTDPEQEWCGSTQKDDMISRVGLVIDAHRGDDTIRAKNGADDEVYGGPGKDTAHLDRGDRINNVQVCIPGPCSRYRRAMRGRAFARTGEFTYPAFKGIVECRREGSPQIWLPNEPALRAVDASKGRDWQTVAIQAVLHKHNGIDWMPVDTREWLWDRVSDKLDFLLLAYGPSWKTFAADKGRRYIGFTVEQGPGAYRLAIREYWYAVGNVPAHEKFVWAGPHYSEDGLENPTHEWCVFP